MGENISNMTWGMPEIRHATLSYFKMDMGISETVTGDIAIS